MSLTHWGGYLGVQGGQKAYASTNPYGIHNVIRTGITTSSVWPAANLAMFFPVSLESPVAVKRFWWENGATAAGNVDMGLYTRDGTRLTSTGSTAQSGTSVLQSADVTDVIVAPGLYYIAIALDDGTATLGGNTFANAAHGKIVGLAEQTTAFALPAVATFATWTRTVWPYCGFVGEASV